MREVAATYKRDGARTDLLQIPGLLNGLVRSDQDVLVLRIIQGLGFRDVAAALGISEEAAKKCAQ